VELPPEQRATLIALGGNNTTKQVFAPPRFQVLMRAELRTGRATSLSPENGSSQGQNLASIVLIVPNSLGSRRWFETLSHTAARTASSRQSWIKSPFPDT